MKRMIMKYNITKVWTDDKSVYIETDNGEIYSEQFSDYPRLRNAVPAQRANFEYDNIGIRWEELDEDLCYAGFMRNSMAQPV
jgi:beta-xylosidase